MKVRIGLKEMVFNLVPTATVQQLIQAKVSRKDEAEEEAGARGKSQREAEQSEREAYL